jgi:methylaspartate mutase epsilon subunit
MSRPPVTRGVAFGKYVAGRRAAGQLVVQPRMGFSAPDRMRSGVLAVKDAAATTAGTITLDSFTRVGDHAAARRHLLDGIALNGFPLVAHGAAVTQAMVEGLVDSGFPVQVRHGSADPQDIVRVMLEAGLTATEGGPISYCLPYSRIPLRRAASAWAASAQVLAAHQPEGIVHVETFGGCLLGQLCPPSLLVAVSLLEGLFFRSHGITSISLSYAQQTSAAQDREAVAALRALARRFLPDVDWHVVIYTYMGLYPQTSGGAEALLDESVQLAVASGAERLIVKTAVEASRIPTVDENVRALERAASVAQQTWPEDSAGVAETATFVEATALVEAVLELDASLDAAIVEAFRRGMLDVPFCLHPDNRNEARSVIAGDGRLEWLDTARMPLPQRHHRGDALSAAGLLQMLSYTAGRFDRAAAPAARVRAIGSGDCR